MKVLVVKKLYLDKDKSIQGETYHCKTKSINLTVNIRSFYEGREIDFWLYRDEYILDPET